MKPTKDAIIEYLELMAEAPDVEAMLRSSGEAMARRDAVWKRAATYDTSEKLQAVSDFILIGQAHTAALSLAGADNALVSTLLALLLSVDMSRIDISLLGEGYADMHVRYFHQLLRHTYTDRHDEFLYTHYRAMLRTEAQILPTVIERTHANSTASIGAAQACVSMLEKEPLGPGDLIIAQGDFKSAYLDMFSRMSAIEPEE